MIHFTQMKPNIIFMVVDSLRADKFYGSNKSSKTPNIDSLIKNGIYFTNAVSSSDVTGICLGNMLTGMYSFKTGITERDFNSKLKTNFDILKDNGYHLYATIPNLTWFHHLTRNFHEKDLFFAANRIQENLSEKVGQQIINRLDSKLMQEPWLYYIHLFDVHQDIIVPKDFDSPYYGDTKYDRVVSQIDHWIGKFLQKIDLKKTLMIITADHGDYIPIVDHVGQIPAIQGMMKKSKQLMPQLEPAGIKLFILIRNVVEFFQRQKLRKTLTDDQMKTLTRRGHKTIFDESIHIPLLFVGSGINSHRIIDNLVGNVDLFLTLLEISGLEYSKINLDGINLIPLFNGDKIDERPLFIESGDTQERKAGLAIGVRTSNYKYFRSRDNPQQNIFLFDLKSDPKETNNIANSQPHLVRMMENTLVEITKHTKEERNELTVEEKQKIARELKKVGYI